MIRTLDRESAKKVIRLFDVCFKQGVYDAHDICDNYEARDFLDRHKAAWDFAVLGQPEPYSWEEWRFTLFHWARMAGLKTFAIDHIYQIVKTTPQWYLLPHCMCFYLMGIEEWLAKPDPTRLQIFKKSPNEHWRTMPSGMRKMNKSDFVECMYGFVFSYRRLPKEEQPFKALSFDGYARAMHTLTRNYAKKKAKIELDEPEDI